MSVAYRFDACLHTNVILLMRREGFALDFPDTHVYELDSSSETKFSRHLIVRIDGHAFYNNIAVGHFVSQVLAESGTSLLVKDKHGRDVYFVDTAVYTKNRHFRLAYSCKGGRKVALLHVVLYRLLRQHRDHFSWLLLQVESLYSSQRFLLVLRGAHLNVRSKGF